MDQLATPQNGQPPLQYIAVLGAGSWGTALAFSLAAHGGHDVRLWARREEQAHEIRTTRRNDRYLRDVSLPENVQVTSDIDEVVRGAWLWVVAVPSQFVRSVAVQLADKVSDAITVVSVAKGIENETLMTTTEVLQDVLPAVERSRIGVLYGPSHAEEVAAAQPTSVVVAFPELEAAERVQEAFLTRALRVYVNTDLRGVEIGGSVKNVMALAAGIGDGMGLGDNAKAGLVTRGLAEIKRLGCAMGADPETFSGLAGMGDLIVTCFSQHSRNRRFGEMIGQGRSTQEAEAAMTMVVEGVRTTTSVRALAQKYGVEMPITEAIHAILFEGLDVHDAARDLLARDPKAEDVNASVRA